MESEQKLPPLNHGYPNCECDLEGGDPDCTIQPPYQTLAARLEKAEALNVEHVKRIAELEAGLRELHGAISRKSHDVDFWWPNYLREPYDAATALLAAGTK